MDEADLARQEKAFVVQVTNAGPVATAKVVMADGRRRPRYEVHVALPRALKVQLAGRGGGSAEVRAVAGLHLDEYRGELTTEALTGPVTGEMRDGRAEFGRGATLTLRTERGRLRADAPASVTLESEDGTIELIDPAGPITLTQDQCRIDVRGTGGPVKVTGEGGTISLRQVAHPLTIEAKRLTVNAELDVPVADHHRHRGRRGGGDAAENGGRAAGGLGHRRRTALAGRPRRHHRRSDAEVRRPD